MMTAIASTSKVETLLPLTRQEERRLQNCEEIIEKGLNTFYDVGSALTEISESRLYRTKYATFEDYCQERWGLSRRRGYELIAAAAVVDNVRNSAQTIPANEAQANELTGLDPEAQTEVWQRVLETADTNAEDKPVVTAAHIKMVVKDYLREHGEEMPDDEGQRKPRQKSDRSEVEALYDPDIQARLTRYMDVITEFENMEWPPELGYLVRMFQLHKSHAHFQKTRNLEDDCEMALTVLKRLSPDIKSGFTIAAQEHYDWLFDLGYCMSKREYTSRMRHMSRDDVRMALLTDAGEEGKQEDRRGKLPGIVVLPWKKIWKLSKPTCEVCGSAFEPREVRGNGKICKECKDEAA